MFYTPPDRWTEKDVDLLPFGEDDRYEWKSGQEIGDPREHNKFFNTLSSEIGAFANSFGGSLFLGLADDRTKLGVPSNVVAKRGTIPIERWLETKIPTLLDVRLQHFRVSRVAELSPETQTDLGADKILLVIDVFDSELAPHQCVFDNK